MTNPNDEFPPEMQARLRANGFEMLGCGTDGAHFIACKFRGHVLFFYGDDRFEVARQSGSMAAKFARPRRKLRVDAQGKEIAWPPLPPDPAAPPDPEKFYADLTTRMRIAGVEILAETVGGEHFIAARCRPVTWFLRGEMIAIVNELQAILIDFLKNVPLPPAELCPVHLHRPRCRRHAGPHGKIVVADTTDRTESTSRGCDGKASNDQAQGRIGQSSK